MCSNDNAAKKGKEKAKRVRELPPGSMRGENFSPILRLGEIQMKSCCKKCDPMWKAARAVEYDANNPPFQCRDLTMEDLQTTFDTFYKNKNRKQSNLELYHYVKCHCTKPSPEREPKNDEKEPKEKSVPKHKRQFFINHKRVCEVKFLQVLEIGRDKLYAFIEDRIDLQTGHTQKAGEEKNEELEIKKAEATQMIRDYFKALKKSVIKTEGDPTRQCTH